MFKHKNTSILKDNELILFFNELGTLLKAGIPLQIDASICYIKEGSCLPITNSDKKNDSLYNTYLHRGLPPGPIGNPGLDAIRLGQGSR